MFLRLYFEDNKMSERACLLLAGFFSSFVKIDEGQFDSKELGLILGTSFRPEDTPGQEPWKLDFTEDGKNEIQEAVKLMLDVILEDCKLFLQQNGRKNKILQLIKRFCD
jgi:hypothetical protein